MKKITILFFMLLASTAFAQIDISTVGGTYAGHTNYPFNVSKGYSRCATIYLPGEINNGGQIIKIGWNSLLGITDSIPIKIYMINTSQINWSGNWTWDNVMSMVGLQLVFDGKVIPKYLWFDITLQTPFTHDITRSLYVIVETNYGGTGMTTSIPTFRCSDPTSGHQRHLIWSSDNTVPAGTVSGSFYNPIPLTRLSFLKETGTPVTSQLVYTHCGYDSLKWTNNVNNDSVIVLVSHTGKKPYLENGVRYQQGTMIDYTYTIPGPVTYGDTVIFRGKASNLTHNAYDLKNKKYYFWHFDNNSNYSASKNKDGFGAISDLPTFNFDQSTATPLGWGLLFFKVTAGHGTTGNAMSVLLKSSTTIGFLNSPSFCGVDANTFLRFKYRYVNETDYPSTATPLANIGDLTVAVTNNGLIYDVYRVSDTNHVVSTNYATVTVPIGSYANGEPFNIQFTANRGNGTYYLDLDDIEVFHFAGIEDITNAGFLIYPNPAEEMITVAFEGEQALQSTINIINMSGQVLKTIEHNNSPSLTIDIKNLAKGIYFINVMSQGKNNFLKFVKM